MRDPILAKALSLRGMTKAVAEKCGISPAAVSRWMSVPETRLQAVAEVTGVSPKRLRPDLFKRRGKSSVSRRGAAGKAPQPTGAPHIVALTPQPGDNFFNQLPDCFEI